MLLRDIFSDLRLDYDSDPEGTPLARSNRALVPCCLREATPPYNLRLQN